MECYYSKKKTKQGRERVNLDLNRFIDLYLRQPTENWFQINAPYK